MNWKKLFLITYWLRGDYFIIIKTCNDCGTPKLPQQ